MKSFKNALVLSVLALAGAGSQAFAEDAPAAILIPHALRCVACGAPMDAVLKVDKNNTIKIEVKRSAATGNPRGN